MKEYETPALHVISPDQGELSPAIELAMAELGNMACGNVTNEDPKEQSQE